MRGHQCVGEPSGGPWGEGQAEAAVSTLRLVSPRHCDPQSLWSLGFLQLSRYVLRQDLICQPSSFFPKGQSGSFEVKHELRSTLTFESHVCLPLNSFETLSKYVTSPLSPFPPL